MKTSEVQRYSSTHYGSDWSASRHGRFTRGVRAPGTHWIGDWVGPSTGLNAVRGEKVAISPGNRTTVVHPYAD
jgi:hypothetical protein